MNQYYATFVLYLKRLTRMQIAFGVSSSVHLLLLGVHIADPNAFNRIFQDSPLEIILVNARSIEPLDKQKPQAIAQFDLKGGGEADKGIVSTPLPVSPNDRTATTLAKSYAKVEQLQAEQIRLLAQTKQQVEELMLTEPKPANAKQAAAQEKKRQQMLKLIGAIEQRIQQENARPKKRYISPSTRAESYAIYYDALRQKIERTGTRHFPTSGGKKLYGELIMVINVNSAGAVVSAEVATSSGSRMLDARAKAIVYQAAPFDRFSPEMCQQSDLLGVVSRFQFTKNDLLEATVSQAQ